MSNRETIAKNVVEVLEDMSDPRVNFVTREPFDVEKLAITQFPALLVTTGNETREDYSMGGNRRGTIEIQIRGVVRSEGRKGQVQTVDEKRNLLIERKGSILFQPKRSGIRTDIARHQNRCGEMFPILTL